MPVGPDLHVAVVLLQADEAVAQVVVELLLLVAGHDGVAAVAVDERGDALFEVEVVGAVVEAHPLLMDVRVDEAGDHVLALGVVDLGGLGVDDRRDGRYAVALDREVALLGRTPGSVDDQAVSDDEIVHAGMLPST